MPGLLHRPLGHAGISELFDPPFACAAKVDSSCVKWRWPQDGHSGASDEARINFSNLVPQSSHLYS
jgi:hypothetical protein